MALLATSPRIALDRVYPYENRYLAYLCRLVGYVDVPFKHSDQWNMQQLLEGADTRIGPFPFTPTSIDASDFAARAITHLWFAFSESLATLEGLSYRYYAEKTWGNNLELLAGAGLKPRLINLVRDPRDVAASIRAFDRKRGYYGFGRQAGQSEADYLGQLVKAMGKALAQMQLRAEHHDHFWLRYEDLIADRGSVVARLSGWLDLELEAGTPSLHSSVYRRHSTTPNPEASIGRWREDLSPVEAAYIRKALGRQMRWLGYDD